MTIPDAKIQLYKKALSTVDNGDVKGGKFLYTSVNGHMFSYLSSEGVMGLRLSKEDQEKFLKKYKTGPFIQYGAVMRDYVTVPPRLLKETSTLKTWVKQSLSFALSMKPKASKKKATKTASKKVAKKTAKKKATKKSPRRK